MREKTYWPKLCLIQVAGPRRGRRHRSAGRGIDLAPLFDLMADEKRAEGVPRRARQDIEIFYHLAGAMPDPLFDTPDRGDGLRLRRRVSYETLVRKLAGAQHRQVARFTDWAQRPLSERQLDYALADVTHLREVYTRSPRNWRGPARALGGRREAR